MTMSKGVPDAVAALAEIVLQRHKLLPCQAQESEMKERAKNWVLHPRVRTGHEQARG